MREIYFSLMKNKFKSKANRNKKLQSSKRKINIGLYQKFTIYYDEMKHRRQSGYFQFEEDSSAEFAQGIAVIVHEVVLLKKFFQTKLQVKSMN